MTKKLLAKSLKENKNLGALLHMSNKEFDASDIFMVDF